MKRELALLLALFLILPMVNAVEVFDYIKNPTPRYLTAFDGSSVARIDTSDTAKQGKFVFQTSLSSAPCIGGSLTSVSQGTINVTSTKNNNCNVGKVYVNIQVDNPDYGTIPYARIGDYSVPTNHISVIPYSFNVWQSENRKSTFNYDVCSRVGSWGDMNTYKYKTGGTFASIVCEPENVLASYVWNYKKKSPVCSTEVITALGAKSTYYSNPSDLTLDGFGSITGSNCKSLMFPETSGLKDRVNALHAEYPEIFHSLYYDQDIQYHAYPFYIDQIEMTCFGINGTKTATVYADSTIPQIPYREYNSDGTYKVFYNDIRMRFPDNIQVYPWTRIAGSTGGETTMEGFQRSDRTMLLMDEKLSKSMEITCPAETSSYLVVVALKKNEIYRHKTPVDATWWWDNVFNISSSSQYYADLSTAGKDKYVLLIRYGTFGFTPSPGNYSVKLPSDGGNRVSDDNPSTAIMTKNQTSGCYSCDMNITVNGTSLGGIGGSGTGSVSNIVSGIDDSALSGLITQSQSENRVEAKADFMEKLMFIGEALLVTIIIFLTLLSLFGLVFVFFMVLRIPEKMKDTIVELFQRGKNL